MDAIAPGTGERSPIASHLTVTGADQLSLVTHPDHAREVATVIVEPVELTGPAGPGPESSPPARD